MEIISRAEAKKLGLRKYFTGKPCNKGHVEYRKISNSHCTECHRLECKKRSAGSKEKEAHRVNQAKYRANNEDKVRAIVRRSLNKAYADNPGKYKAKVARRKAFKLHATPKWVTDKEFEQIKILYENCPSGCQVDHIIPLRGTNVCGLHTLKNLQYLTSEDNASKKNNFTPYYQGKYDYTKPILEVASLSYSKFEKFLVYFETKNSKGETHGRVSN